MKSGVEHVVSDSEKYFDEKTTDSCPSTLPNPGFSILLNTPTRIAVWDTRHGTRISRPIRQFRYGGVDIERKGVMAAPQVVLCLVLFLCKEIFQEYKDVVAIEDVRIYYGEERGG